MKQMPSLSMKIVLSICVILVLVGTTLKLFELCSKEIANYILVFGIAFGISFLIYGVFRKD